MYCHYCCRDYKWPCEGPLFHFRVKWSHSLFLFMLKQYWMRLSRDVWSNQDKMTPAWPGDSSNALLFVSWISRAMDWGRHNWVWDKPPVSRLKPFKFHQVLSPHINVIFRPGHVIFSCYWNSHFTGTMVRHPHHDKDNDNDNRVSGIGAMDPCPLLSQLTDTLSSSRSKPMAGPLPEQHS